jgi:hypothetical protein
MESLALSSNPASSSSASSSHGAHVHDWTPIDGWTARYRCTVCFVVGYKPRVVTVGVEGGPYGSMQITPYLCGAKRGADRCGCPAQSKRGGTWKCRSHLLKTSGQHIVAARDALARTEPRSGRVEKIVVPLSWTSPAGG